MCFEVMLYVEISVWGWQWSKMVLADMVHDQKIEENVQEIQVAPLSRL